MRQLGEAGETIAEILTMLDPFSILGIAKSLGVSPSKIVAAVPGLYKDASQELAQKAAIAFAEAGIKATETERQIH